MTKISNCINSEARIYGLKLLGIAFGIICMVVVWSQTSMVFGVISASIGYFAGDQFSRYWYRGIIQKYIYWNLYFLRFVYAKNMPRSNKRYFI